MILIFLLFFFLFLTGSEIYLRKFYHEKLKTHVYPKIYEPHANFGYKYIPNKSSVLIQPFRQVKVKVNNQGFLGPDFSLNKNDSSFRIIIVSYSLLFEEKGRIQNLFARKGFSNIEVINCSVDGRSLNWYQYSRIKNDLIKFSPDLILFDTKIPFERGDCSRICYKGFVISYSYESPDLKKWGMNYVDTIINNKFLTNLYDTFYIIRAINRVAVNRYLTYARPGSSTKKFLDRYILNRYILGFYSLNMVNAGEYIIYTYTIDETIDHLRNLVLHLSSNGSNFTIFDYFEGDIEKCKLCKDNAINYINLGISREYYGNELRIKNDGHPTEKGNNEIAKAFYKSLVASKLIPQKYLQKTSSQASESL